MAGIAKRHQAVFAELREDSTDNAVAAPADVYAATGLAGQRHYLLAWSRLLVHTPLPCPNPWFITTDAELADALLARYRQDGLGKAISLPEIRLPAAPDAADALPPALAQTLAALQTATAGNEARAAAGAFGLRTVETLHSTPAPDLELHVLPRASLPALLSGLFAENAAATRNRQSAETPCLLGVLRNTQ